MMCHNVNTKINRTTFITLLVILFLLFIDNSVGKICPIIFTILYYLRLLYGSHDEYFNKNHTFWLSLNFF